MTHTLRPWIGVSRLAIAASLALAVAASVVPVEAGQRRARLSRDLADRLAARVDAPADVIVSANDDQAEQIATRYGARIKKRLKDAVVLEVSGGQLGGSAPTRTSPASRVTCRSRPWG
jgi:DNA-binding transcriptional regulator LsrR (DeoR family)